MQIPTAPPEPPTSDPPPVASAHPAWQRWLALGATAAVALAGGAVIDREVLVRQPGGVGRFWDKCNTILRGRAQANATAIVDNATVDLSVASGALLRHDGDHRVYRAVSVYAGPKIDTETESEAMAYSHGLGQTAGANSAPIDELLQPSGFYADGETVHLPPGDLDIAELDVPPDVVVSTWSADEIIDPDGIVVMWDEWMVPRTGRIEVRTEVPLTDTRLPGDVCLPGDDIRDPTVAKAVAEELGRGF